MILIDAQNTAEYETEFVLCIGCLQLHSHINIGSYDLYLKTRWKEQISLNNI